MSVDLDAKTRCKREETKASNRQAIIDAARRVFAELGHGATTVRDIIRATDLASGTFYNYFKSKEEVFQALQDETALRVRPRLRAERIRARNFFARMEWKDDNTLSTSWYCLEQRLVEAVPDSLIIPLPSKIGIPYDIVETAIVEINQLIHLFAIQRAGKPVEWEIRLDTVNKLKLEIISDPDINPEERSRLLTRHMPKHIWRAIAWVDSSQGTPRGALEILVDPTPFQQEGALVDALMRGDFLANAIVGSLQQPKVSAGSKNARLWELTGERPTGAVDGCPNACG